MPALRDVATYPFQKSSILPRFAMNSVCATGLSDKSACIHRVLPLARRKMGDVELVESDDGADSRQELSMVASKLFLTEFVVPDKEK